MLRMETAKRHMVKDYGHFMPFLNLHANETRTVRPKGSVWLYS